MYMSRVNNNSNQSLGSLRYKPYLDNVTPVQKGQIDRLSGKEKTFSDNLGDYYKKAKDTVWGTPTYSLTKNKEGLFDLNVWGDKDWAAFEKAGGQLGANGELLNADGSAFDVSNFGGDVSKLTSKTEGGLGELFTVDSLKTAGEAASNLGKVFGMYQAGDNIFGQGAKSRREAERQMKKDFEQRYAMNKMTMDKFREDNEHFKKQRAAITASY